MDEARYLEFLKERREWILGRVREACARVGRDAADVEVLAVSKTVDAASVALAREAGYRTFGENRPQELV
ncbi:alanine racemase domain-containing protein, partial [gut metagenome]